MCAVYVRWHLFNGGFRAIFALYSKQFKPPQRPSIHAKIGRFAIRPDSYV